MDHNTWLWRKKSTEKSIVASDEISFSVKGNDEEMHALLTDKEKLERDLTNLTAKLSFALSESNAKDDLVRTQMKISQEATEGWEKAEVEAKYLKQALNEALQQRLASEERLINVDSALKECMQQLRFVREEQEQRIHDAVMKTSREHEKSQKVLEEKLAETSKRLSIVAVENTHLSKVLLLKEKLIEDLNKQRTHAETKFNALMERLETTEKENASLKYEVRVLEKELEIRNEEREFNHRTDDASHKQHLENVKKIAKLESECQRLRLLIRKRLPGPAALAQMKNEVEMLGMDAMDPRRIRVNANPNCLKVDSSHDNSPDTPKKRISFLNDQLHAMEEENKILKEALITKSNELQLSKITYACAASKSLKGQTIMEQTRSSLIACDLSLASMSDIGSEDKVSCTESWASALVPELEHFTNKKQNGSPSGKTTGASDIDLMDDFVEMEKLALVSVEKPSVTSCGSSVETTAIRPLEIVLSNSSSDCQLGFSVLNQEIQTKDTLTGKVPGWLQDVLKVISEQNRLSKRNLDEILEDIRVGLARLNHPNPGESLDAKEGSNKSSSMDLFSKVTNVDESSAEKSKQQFQSDSVLRKSIYKIIELIEGISLPYLGYDNPKTLSTNEGGVVSYKPAETPTGYMVRVFQWKISELTVVLHQFVHTCYDLLNGKADLDKFGQELTSTLDWIINHCFSIQDVSSMRDETKKHFNWDETKNEAEVEVGLLGQFSELDKLRLRKEQLSNFPLGAADGQYRVCWMEELHSKVREENKKLNAELITIESANRDLEKRLQSAIEKSEFQMNQLQESERSIANMKKEIQNLKESKKTILNQTENHKLMSEDFDVQLTVARIELNDTRNTISSLESELEKKSNCCEELESMCQQLKLQLESLVKKKFPNCDLIQDEKQIHTDWEITAASQKLAACQETILDLGKQLKAIASPKEAALFDKIIFTPTDSNAPATNTAAVMDTAPSFPKSKNTKHRSSLLHQMLADNDAVSKDPEFPETKEVDGHSDSTFGTNRSVNQQKYILSEQIKHNDGDAAVSSLAIVPFKEHSGRSFWKNLWRRKKANGKKLPLPFDP